MKTCSECNAEKPLPKFYKHPWEPDGYMPRCKFCHNGGQELKRRQEEFFSERQLGDPSEEAIRLACEKIKAKWTDKQRARRSRRAATTSSCRTTSLPTTRDSSWMISQSISASLGRSR